MEKSTGVQWYVEYAPEKHSIRAERVDDQVGSGDVCGV